MNIQYVTDLSGNKKSIILPIEDYETLLKEIEELEELNDVKLFDQAKKEDDGTRVSLAEYLNRRKTRQNNVRSIPE